jgi:hypothetical protein
MWFDRLTTNGLNLYFANNPLALPWNQYCWEYVQD